MGGWERIWTNASSSAFLGGPSAREFSRRGVAVGQVSARNYVYGPGESGITIEYLHSVNADATAPIKVLLTRPGTVTNLGENVFQLDFGTPMDEYEVLYDKAKGTDRLANCVPILTPGGSPSGLFDCKPTDGGAERGAPASSLLVRTTCACCHLPGAIARPLLVRAVSDTCADAWCSADLSERLWIVRDARGGDSVAVFQRTETRSVMDRRGLVADGQLKPPDDEQVRYGKLLFGETLQEYSVRRPRIRRRCACASARARHDSPRSSARLARLGGRGGTRNRRSSSVRRTSCSAPRGVRSRRQSTRGGG